MMKYLVAILLGLFLIGCSDDKKEPTTPEEAYELVFLFEKDGCKVYRFYDESYHRYFTDCRGSVSWVDTQSKRSVHQDVPTEQKACE